MRQVLFRIPPWSDTGLPIYGYGMMLFLAFIICNWLAGRRAIKEGIPKERVQDLAIWLFVGGLIGARTTYLLAGPAEDRPATLMDFLWQFPRIWDGGIIFYGSVIGGLAGYGLAYLLILRKHNLSTWKMADIIAPCAALGLALGRIGCLLNGCCYGNVACPGCPALHFPLCAPPRYELVKFGWQTAAGFVMTDRDGEDLRIVQAVTSASPAAASGLRAGDIIVRADDQEIRSHLFVIARDPEDPKQKKEPVVRQFSSLAGARSFLDQLHKEQKEVVDVHDDLEEYFVHRWPRGKTELELTVERDGQEVHLPPFKPRTLGLHPTQVYETISMILLFGLLMAFYPFRRHDGEVMVLLMICYGLHRYLNERLRVDPRPVGFEAYVSLILIGGALLIGLWLWRKPAQYPSSAAKVPV